MSEQETREYLTRIEMLQGYLFDDADAMIEAELRAEERAYRKSQRYYANALERYMAAVA